MNKTKGEKKSDSTPQKETFDKNSVSTKRKNCSHCQELKNSKKIGLNLISRMKSQLKKTRIKIVEKYDFTGPKNCFHSNQSLQKFRKTVSTSKSKIFINIGLPLIAVMVSKKYEWANTVSAKQKIGFHQREWRICLRIRFCQTKKLLLLTGIYKKSNKMVANSRNKSFKQASLYLNNGFHQQEKKF